MAVTSYAMQDVDDKVHAELEHVEIMKPNPKAMPATGTASSSYGPGTRSSPYHRVRQQAKPGAVKPAAEPAPVVVAHPAAADIGWIAPEPVEPPTVQTLCENFTPVAQDADIDPPLEPIALAVRTGEVSLARAIDKFNVVTTSCLDQVAHTVFYPVHHDDTFIRCFECPIYKNKAGWYFFASTQGWFLSTELFDDLSSIEATNKDCT